jgi:hypothetical protein
MVSWFFENLITTLLTNKEIYPGILVKEVI